MAKFIKCKKELQSIYGQMFSPDVLFRVDGVYTNGLKVTIPISVYAANCSDKAKAPLVDKDGVYLEELSYTAADEAEIDALTNVIVFTKAVELLIDRTGYLPADFEVATV